MNTPALITALHTLCRAPLQFGAHLTGAMLVQLGVQCLALFTAIGHLVHQSGDPRLVLAYSDMVEQFAQQLHLAQLTIALDAEASGAHALSLETYDALRDGTCSFEANPELAAGRTCYKSTGDLLAAWLGLNYFEAQRRIEDAHLLIGRRTPQGTICEPRFPHLAKVYSEGSADRRTIAATARRLEKLETTDTTFDGIPAELKARDTDGRLLEEHAAESLRGLGPNAARKEISTRISLYKQLNGDKLPPKLGLFIGPVVQGVHEFTLRTLATQAQLIRSMAVQSSDPRTKAGKAARSHAQADGNSETINDPASDPVATEPTDLAAAEPVEISGLPGTTMETTAETPQWMRTELPMPAWACADPETTEAAPDQVAAGGEDDANGESASGSGEVSVELRRLNALMAILASPAVGGKSHPVIPRFFVYMWLSDLQNLGRAHGITSNGVQLPPGELRRALAKANVIPVVLGGNSQPLDMGRSRRYHEGYVRMGVLARDRGCIVPDCTTAPDQVEIDHYKRPWSEGGTTSVRSGVAVCPDGHHSRHVGHIDIVDVDGLPHVILPPHLDPEQKPRRNTYWDALQLGDAPIPDPANSESADSPEMEDPPENLG
ncbi:HNH endonuclease signature motif containing protein [Glutamicibacter arilaitensis]|uniref:HNH endonuclease signature motif containing protein n=1 Tax=Glutamicibacter arilaitensis TaxID=256701 RepID=UPI00384E6B3C